MNNNFSSDWDVFSDDNDDLSGPSSSSSEDHEYETSENDGSQNDSSGDDISDDESVIENTITDYSGGQASVKKYLNTNPKQIQIKEKTVTWIVKNCRPFEIVKDPALVKAFNIADPKVSLPGPDLVKKEVTNLEIKHTKQFIEEMKHVKWIAFTWINK